MVRAFGMNPKVRGFESLSCRDIFCLKNLHRNIRSCVENECCCLRPVNISDVNFTLRINTYIYIIYAVCRCQQQYRSVSFNIRNHVIWWPSLKMMCTMVHYWVSEPLNDGTVIYLKSTRVINVMHGKLHIAENNHVNSLQPVNIHLLGV